MTEADIMAIMRDALMLAMKLAIPMLVISLVLGLVVAVFQAATQIHEQTLTFIPKAVVIAIILLVAVWCREKKRPAATSGGTEDC